MSEEAKGPGKALILGSVKSAHELLTLRADQFAGLLPVGVKPERFAKVVLQSVRSIPGLMACTQASFLEAALQCAALGLEPARGQAYLIPYRDKRRGITVAQFQLGWQGMLELAKRSGEYTALEAHVVRNKDLAFRVTRGLHPDIIHEPSLEAEVGSLTHVYAVAWPASGGHPIFEVMNRAQVDAIRQRSRAGNDGPWVTDFDEMARKTVFRRLAKWLRLTPEVATAFEMDAVREYGTDGAAQAMGQTVISAIEDDTVSAAEAVRVMEEEASAAEVQSGNGSATDDLAAQLSGTVAASKVAEREAEKLRQLDELEKIAAAKPVPKEVPVVEVPVPAPVAIESPPEAPAAVSAPILSQPSVPVAPEPQKATGGPDAPDDQEDDRIRLFQGVGDEYPQWVGDLPNIRVLRSVLSKIDHPDTVADMWYKDARSSAQDAYNARLLALGVATPENMLMRRVREATIRAQGDARTSRPPTPSPAPTQDDDELQDGLNKPQADLNF